MTLIARLTALERRHPPGPPRCRCPFDYEWFRLNVIPVMGVGGRTPATCDRCGGARPAIEFAAMDSAIAWRGRP